MSLYHACRACIAPMDRSLPRWQRSGEMVEAPGTAPGSTTIIPRTVYRHSRVVRRDGLDIVIFAQLWKGGMEGAAMEGSRSRWQSQPYDPEPRTARRTRLPR